MKRELKWCDMDPEICRECGSDCVDDEECQWNQRRNREIATEAANRAARIEANYQRNMAGGMWGENGK